MKAFEVLTISDSVKALSAGIYSKNSGLECCNKATIMVDLAGIRYRVDGGEPTASVGLFANSGDVITLLGRSELKLFRAIRSTSTSASISCDYGVAREDA